MDIKIYKKDKNRDQNEKIIVKVCDVVNFWIITTKNAIDDYMKTGSLIYDAKSSNFAIINYLLQNNKRKEGN